MPLVIETGAGVANADSYVTLAEARAYATSRGITLPVDAALEVLLIKAKDYLESLRGDYIGTKVHVEDVYLQWPRYDVEVDGYTYTEVQIPKLLKDAQCQLAIDLQTVDPFAASQAVAVKEEQVGPLKTVYAINDGDGAVVRMPKVDAILAPLLRDVGFLSVTRV